MIILSCPCTNSLWSCSHHSLPHTPSSHVLLMPNSKHLTHGISNLVSLITKTKLGLSSSPLDPRKDQVLSTGWFFDTPSRWITHNRSQDELGHLQAHRMITKLPIATKPSRWWWSPRVTSKNSHLTTTSLMRRWMHTCYSLDTSEDSHTWILMTQISLGLLHFLPHERSFSADQMSKSASMEG
jgi:hypothetical protein